MGSVTSSSVGNPTRIRSADSFREAGALLGEACKVKHEGMVKGDPIDPGGNGAFDLVCGDLAGYFTLVRNTGTAAAPAFTPPEPIRDASWRAGQDLPGKHPARQQLGAELRPAQTLPVRLGRRRPAGSHRRQQHQPDLLAGGLRPAPQPHRRAARAGGARHGRSVRIPQGARGGRLRRRRAHGADSGGQPRADQRVSPGRRRRRHPRAGAAGAAHLPRRRHAAELRHRTGAGRNGRRSLPRRACPRCGASRASRWRPATGTGRGVFDLFISSNWYTFYLENSGTLEAPRFERPQADPHPGTARRTSSPSTRAMSPPTTGTATAPRT